MTATAQRAVLHGQADNDPDETIETLVARGIREGVTFIGHPDGPVRLQIRVLRSASAAGHTIAQALRNRRDETDAFFRAYRPAPLSIAADGWPPMPEWGSVTEAAWMLHLQATIADTEATNVIEAAGRELLEIRAEFRQRCAAILGRARSAEQR